MIFLTELIGWIATIFRSAGMLCKSANMVKYLVSIGNFCWMINGIMTNNIPLIASNAICLLIMLIDIIKIKIMQIIQPSAILWKMNNGIAEHIARCARVCYASDKTTDATNFCKNLWKNKHRSMFRHAGAYYIIPNKLQIEKAAFKDAMVKSIGFYNYVSTNEQAALEYWDPVYSKYRINVWEAETNKVFREYKMIRYTFCIETGIDITREYNRKSPNSISEQSTRYVDFNKKIGICFKHCHWMTNLSIWKYFLVRFMCKTIEWFYKISRSKYGLNLKPQDARWILALDTMSKVCYTYTVKDWERIINMRLFDWTGIAHPDAKIIAKEIKEQLEKEGYTIENYNNYEKYDCSSSVY